MIAYQNGLRQNNGAFVSKLVVLQVQGSQCHVDLKVCIRTRKAQTVPVTCSASDTRSTALLGSRQPWRLSVWSDLLTCKKGRLNIRTRRKRRLLPSASSRGQWQPRF